MKKILTMLLICLAAAGVFTADSVWAKEEIIKTQLEKREFQTRTFDTTDKPMIMKAMLNVLQDEGFIVNNANPLLGFISGTKEFDVTDKTIDLKKEFGAKKLNWAGVRVAAIETTANVSEYGKQIRVRINFKRKLLNVYGNAQSITEIDDSQYYQDFFAKVDKAIFLQKQKI
ncbi:MAG: hypothetical protein LBK53_05005 [Heliobacteriaceae bacterium]|jgi:hypothetical protein|nr:hypothetical protein [Heliobacteriaceae bacterium]